MLPTCSAVSIRAGRNCWLRGTNARRASMPERSPISCPRPPNPRGRLEGRADAAGPPRPPRGDHRPGRPEDDHQRAQLAAPTSSWPTSRTPTRRPGTTCSRASSTCATPCAGDHQLRRSADGKHYELNEKTAVLLVRPRGWHLPEKHLLVDGEPMSGVALRLRPLLLPQRAGADGARAPARTSTCRRWRATSRRGCGTTSSSSRAGDARHAAGHHQGDGADRDASSPPSRWTRSSTSCASTRPGSTAAAGTTSSASSRSSASDPDCRAARPRAGHHGPRTSCEPTRSC